jgi:hypothetical protein
MANDPMATNRNTVRHIFIWLNSFKIGQLWRGTRRAG